MIDQVHLFVTFSIFNKKKNDEKIELFKDASANDS